MHLCEKIILKHYAIYHTNVKLCYSLGIEKQIFSKEFLEKVPSSTSEYWKKKAVGNYVGSEYEEIANQTLSELKIIADFRVKEMRKLFVAICRLYLSIINLLGEKKFIKLLKDHRKTLLPLIEDASKIFEDKNMLYKLLKINSRTISFWKKYQNFQCTKSLISLCYKKVVNQISVKEIETMKTLLQDKQYQHWSSASVWGFAVKNGMVSMAKSTWYHYAKLLNLNSTRKKYKAIRKRISVRAEIPNQIWHMDVSYYKTADQVQYYIYTVVDNFSRKVLAYDVSKELSGKQRLQSLKRAIDREFGAERKEFLENKKLELIVDGGSENNNFTIEDFIKTSQVEIEKKIALKDVVFSNSIAEGTFKTLKAYLRTKVEILEADLEKEIDFFIKDYNEVRPHYYHEIYTPNEIYDNPKLKEVKPYLQKVTQERMTANRMFSCEGIC